MTSDGKTLDASAVTAVTAQVRPAGRLRSADAQPSQPRRWQYRQTSRPSPSWQARTTSAQAVTLPDPKATIPGKQTLSGGWRNEEKWDVNTAQTKATRTRRLSTTVLVKTTSPSFKFPVAYSLTLYREGGPASVHEQSLVRAFSE